MKQKFVLFFVIVIAAMMAPAASGVKVSMGSCDELVAFSGSFCSDSQTCLGYDQEAIDPDVYVPCPKGTSCVSDETVNSIAGCYCDDNDGDFHCGTIDDCDDAQPAAYTGNPEVCGDGIDNDCDGSIDEKCVCNDGETKEVTCGDFGECVRTATLTCENHQWGECVPGTPADEALTPCDGLDNDCDGKTDENLDLDNDGYTTCDIPSNINKDCNDNDNRIHPFAQEVCDQLVDYDCDSLVKFRDPDCHYYILKPIIFNITLSEEIIMKDMIAFTWDFGDGTVFGTPYVDEALPAQHSYFSIGDDDGGYTIIFRMMDKYFNIYTATQDIRIELSPEGGICGSKWDCDGGYCNPEGICSTPNCTDMWMNGDETDVDCGGECNDEGKRCGIRKKCGDGSDCFSGNCVEGQVGKQCWFVEGSCRMALNCEDDEGCVFSVSDIKNAHVSRDCGDTGYPLKICCPGLVSIENPAAGTQYDSLMGVSSYTDAHAQKSGCMDMAAGCSDVYTDIYVKNPENTPVTCEYNEGGCPSGICVTGISDFTNAHVGSCDDYYDKICCNVGDVECGNGYVEGSEVCDGTSLGGQSCQSLGLGGGTLSCKPDCTGFDTAGCGNIVFVTSEGFNGNLRYAAAEIGYMDTSGKGLLSADVLCNYLADAAAATKPILADRTFKAWLSSSSVSASDRLAHSPNRYILVDGTILVADNWNGLVSLTPMAFEGSAGGNFGPGAGTYLKNPINKDEKGNAVSGAAVVWTNTMTDGTKKETNPSRTCSDWTDDDVHEDGRVGLASNKDIKWTEDNQEYGCSSTARLYCISQ